MQTKLKKYLKEQNLDGLLLIGDSICDPDMYYLTGFSAVDRFTILAGEMVIMLVSSMELGRAKHESSADKVVSTSEYGIRELLKASGKPWEAYTAALIEFLRDLEVRRIGVPQRFPAGIFTKLSKEFQVSIVESPVSKWREVKSEQEIQAIRVVQRACEKAMSLAIDSISRSEPKGDYLYADGNPLTSEKVRSTIEISLLEEGCDAIDTIVAGGIAAANPHACGSGPIPANSPVVIDIFPRSKSSRYFADMTRTVVRGEASPEIVDIYDAVAAAQDAGINAVRAGADGKEIHSRVSQVFNDLGYPQGENSGFIHSTGHGVGLEVHESPSLSEAGEVLQAGSVVTVEPGLYYPDLGGVRLEDLVVVRKDGCDNLTEFERRFVV
jgi:Xaa-Pro aminopeptidase